MSNDILEILKTQLRKGYELGGGEVCLVAAHDLEMFIAEIKHLRALNAELMSVLQGIETEPVLVSDGVFGFERAFLRCQEKARAVIAKAKGESCS